MVRQRIKDAVLGNRVGARLYGAVQENWFDWTYRRRRERYELALLGDNDAHRPAAHVARALARISARGHVTPQRVPGEVHTFAYIPSNWPHQNHIANGLSALGPVTRFDYTTIGFDLSNLRSATPGAKDKRQTLAARLRDEVHRANAKNPLDIFFSYGLGWDIDAALIRELQAELGIPFVNISLDDKNWWDEIERGDSASAIKHIAPAFDLNWTSARAVLPWHWAEGAQAVFLPEGVNVDKFCPLEIQQDVPIGFVGNRFGYRPEILASLRRANLPIVVHGTGWEHGPLDDVDMLRFFNRCRIILGLGDMHYSRWLTNLKGRDFEAPAVGRGLYLTTYNVDLAGCFHIGQEIQCYRGMDELIELARYSLRNQEESSEMARRARDRCIAEHQWQHRYLKLLQTLKIVA